MSPTNQPTEMTPRLSLTLIVATSPTLGIGLRGSLPWRLKTEMAYFARVTSRVPASYDLDAADGSATSTTTANKKPQNAVIMGRKTWESIPARFRPLRNRLNVVVSRSAAASSSKAREEGMSEDSAVWCQSLEGAVALLSRSHASSSSSSSSSTSESLPRIARAFVIGGAQIYSAALHLEQTDSVLLTRVDGDWQCDTFFPLDFDKDERWRREDLRTLKEWTGEEIPDGRIKEGDTEFEYRLYTRVS